MAKYQPLRFWILLLRQICSSIGAEVAPGVCEIFPNDRAESEPVGKAIRAPGTFNPKTGFCSKIEFENITPLLGTLTSRWTATIGKDVPLPRSNGPLLSLDRSIYNYSLSTEKIINKAITDHPVIKFGTRNTVLMSLIGDLAHKFGRQKSEQIVKLHYERYRSFTRTPWSDHQEEFCNAWNGMVSKISARSFSDCSLIFQGRFT